jgi:hypothetical protein
MLIQRLISVFALRSYCAAHRPLQEISPDVLKEGEDTTAICAICCEEVDPRNFLSTLWAPCCEKKSVVPKRLLAEARFGCWLLF